MMFRIFFSHRQLGLPSSVFPSSFPIKILFFSLSSLSYVLHAPPTSYLTLTYCTDVTFCFINTAHCFIFQYNNTSSSTKLSARTAQSAGILCSACRMLFWRNCRKVIRKVHGRNEAGGIIFCSYILFPSSSIRLESHFLSKFTSVHLFIKAEHTSETTVWTTVLLLESVKFCGNL